ncbi:hypothetical protein FRC09_018883 [Ceratobasidium sp. 395]|nr:hypothetical protein FRC09_018883 [Ceratobasidium sp. 395]
MTYRSTTHKLFEVPELLGTICKYAGCQRSPHLLRISKAFFRVVVPLVWEETVGVHNLLNLLPDVSSKAKEDPAKLKLRGDKEDIIIVVLFELGEAAADFARFDLYARFVKRLKVFSPAVLSYQVNGWRQLSELVKHQVLLPNLLELAIEPSPSPSSSLDQNIFLWIRTFLSPSLTSIVVGVGSEYKELPTVPGLVAKSLLGHIEATCHNLRHFQLFPELPEDCDTSKGRGDLVVADFWERSFFERLIGLQLRELGCTTELISPKWIHLLSEFSSLRTLDLYTVPREISDPEPISLPHLEHLGLHFTTCYGLEKVANIGLLGGLRSLKISFQDSLVDDGWEKDMIRLISRNSPELTKLHFEFDEAYDYIPEMSSFRPLGALPLMEVCLKGGVSMPDHQLEDLGAIWPNVTRFKMWDPQGDSLQIEQLQYFTKLPRLQHLALDVSWFNGIPQPIVSAEPSYALRVFEMLNETLYADFDVALLARIVSPLVWETVVGVEHILKLLSGVSTTIKVSDKDKNKKSLIINVSNLADTGGERFNYYAPFVKNLEIYRPSSRRDYQIVGWRRLLRHVQKHNLLPNLARLTMSALSMSSHDQFLWIRAFLSPSLNTIQVIPDADDGPCEISSLVAGSLLGQIIKSCPNIRSISLFPSTSTSVSETNGFVAADFCDSSFYDRLSALRLTELGCTTQILSEDSIHVLESLPLLERLDLFSADIEIVAVNLSSPPPLKHLGVYLVDWHEIQEIWKLNIFATLASIVILLREHYDFDWSTNDEWGNRFITLVCSRSPALASISLDFGPTGYSLNQLSSLDSMAKLPLTAVCFKSLESMGDEVVENMVTVFPMAIKLEFYDMDFRFDELIHLAKLPRLQHILIGLSGHTREINLGPPLAVSHSLHTLEVCNGIVDVGPDISLLARYALAILCLANIECTRSRYLLSLWPNLQQVLWPQLQNFADEPDSLSETSVVESLNGFIISHRNFNRLKSKIVAAYGANALNQLMK